MHLAKTIATLALAGAFALSSFAGASAQQPPSPPGQPTNQAAGGFGPTWLAAVVSSTGTHVAGTGGLGLVSTNRTSTGRYEVEFRRNRDRCVATGSIGNRGSTATDGFIDIVHRNGNPKAYFVETRDITGILADRDFILLIYCTS